jgi:hypothetical protein
MPVMDAAIVDKEQVAGIAGCQLQTPLHMADGFQGAVDEGLALQAGVKTGTTYGTQITKQTQQMYCQFWYWSGVCREVHQLVGQHLLCLLHLKHACWPHPLAPAVQSMWPPAL